MDDLISRQAAIAAVGSMLRRKFGIGGDLAEITLSGLQSAQPEIISCKDCRFYQQSEVDPDRKMCRRKDVDGWPICYDFYPTDYCSYGERNEDARGKDKTT